MNNDLTQARKLILTCQETQNPYLDLGNCGITDLDELPELFECTHLETLILSNRWIDYEQNEWVESQNNGVFNELENLSEAIIQLKNLTTLIAGGDYDTWKLGDISFLEKLNRLQSLDISRTQVTDFDFLKKLSKLKLLDLSFNQISDINFLEKLTTLEALNLSFNQISDISFLGKLSRLKYLNLSDNEISDISHIEKLTSIESLTLFSTQISDTNFLEKLTRLRFLDLSDNHILDFSYLEKLTGLEFLILNNTPISDFSLLEKLTKLKSLNLSVNHISNFNFLEKLSDLQSLELSNTQITDISFLEKLTTLQSLNLSDNHISDISFLEKLTGLEYLDLSDNNISEISFLAKLHNLLELRLFGNQISYVHIVENLPRLQALFLNNNHISNINFGKNLTQLQVLDLSVNKITHINFLKNVNQLKVLNLRSNQISNIKILEKLTDLHELDLSSNRVEDINPVERLSRLRILNLGINNITEISSLGNLTYLKKLSLSANYISDYDILYKLTSLESLDLSISQISDYNFLDKLTNLRVLDLNSNHLYDINILEGLTSLIYLDLSENQISDVSPLAKLSRLKTLNLCDNQIVEVPLSIFRLEMNIYLDDYSRGGLRLNGNSIESPPLDILKQGKQSVLDWFAANKKKLNEIKVILIGAPEAGKTSLLRRLKDNTFMEGEAQTDGVNIEDIAFGNCETFEDQTALQEITGHFWDFGGQETMNATHQFFLTKRSVYVLVLEARHDAGISSQIRQWVKRIRASSGNSSIIIVANKIDIHTGFGFENEYELQEEFPQIKAFIKASCSTGENIDILKNKLADLIPQAELFNTSIDEKWISIKEQLQAETKEEYFLNEARFRAICREFNLHDKQAQKNAIEFLNDLGLVLHFDDINLSEYYVLDPYWITYGVYQVLTSSLAGKNKGKVSMLDLDYIINEEEDKREIYRPANYKKIEYSHNQRRFLVDILNQFKLSFYLSNRTHFIIPDLLDTNEPIKITSPIRESTESIRFVYEYEYLPKSIMPHFMVEAHKIISNMWRTGCVLKTAACEALLSTYQNRLSIVVIGDHKKKREFMAIIRHHIDAINQKLSHQPNMLIPLPGIDAYADYEELLEREKDGERYYSIYKPQKKKFEISELLDGIPTQDEVREINKKLERLLENQDHLKDGQNTLINYQRTLIIKLDAHYQHLINQPDNRIIKEEILEAIAELNTQQFKEVTTYLLQCIGTAFELHGEDMDEKLNDIYTDLQKSDDLQMKLKLGIPLGNLIGFNLEGEFDIKSWASKKYQENQLKIYKLLGHI